MSEAEKRKRIRYKEKRKRWITVGAARLRGYDESVRAGPDTRGR